MRILVTGGTGVIGAGVIPELLQGGHHVRLLSRGAPRDARQFPGPVEPFAADVAEPSTLAGAADGCEVVIHISGIVDETPPDKTFERVNVQGTRHMLEEAERAGVRRFIFMSSLGAGTGRSDYHQSKLRGEQLVSLWKREWVILRPGNVYGPGDTVVSMLLKLVRSLPAVPVVGAGEQRFQPIWFEDLGVAVAETVSRPEVDHQLLELAGPEITTTRDLIERLSQITERRPATVPVPTALVAAAARLAEGSNTLEHWFNKAGLTLPITTTKLDMLLEENLVRPPEVNGLPQLLARGATPLDVGLRRLAHELPELSPEDGVGDMERKTFWAEIVGSPYDAPTLLREVKARLAELMPLETQAESDPADVRAGATLTMAIPGRGHIQVRVVDESDRHFTFMTVEGHPLAGTVTFRGEEFGRTVRFAIEINARAANFLDWLAMRTVGRAAQSANWREVVRRVVELSGGSAPDGVQTNQRVLTEAEAGRAAEHMAELVPVSR
jgi:uncharacterized protein YbjT (DUF2867 family)